jgi:AcrR family transcriptional regulator
LPKARYIPYRHFADKDALLNALMADGLAAWEERVRAIRAKAPLQWLERLTDEFLSFALEEPHRFDAAFFLPAPKARQYPDDFAAGRSPVIGMAVVKIDQARAEGLLGDTPALDVALTLSALAQGLISMHRARRFSSDAEFAALLSEVLLYFWLGLTVFSQRSAPQALRSCWTPRHACRREFPPTRSCLRGRRTRKSALSTG